MDFSMLHGISDGDMQPTLQRVSTWSPIVVAGVFGGLQEPGVIVVFVVAFGAAIVQGVLGFGFGMTAMACLSLIIPIREAVPLVALLGLSLNMGLSWRYRRTALPLEAWWMVGGGALGVPLGLAFLVSAPTQVLLLVLGLVLVGYAGLRVIRPTTTVRPPGWIGGFAGLFGGALGAAFNAGGPPVVLYVSARDDWSSIVVKRVLTAFFVLSSTLAVLSLTAAGLLGVQEIWRAAVGIPAAGLGGWAGHALSHRLSEAGFRRAVVGGIGILGAVFVYRGLMGG
jgi:hypothetical protein